MAWSTHASPIDKASGACTQIHCGCHRVNCEPPLSPLGTVPFEPLWVCLMNASHSPWEGNIFWPNWAHIKSWKTSSERAFWERFRGRGRGRVKSGVGVRVRKTLKKPVGWGWKWPSLKDGLGFSSKRKEIVLFPFFWKIFSLGLIMLKSIILPTKWSLLLSVSPQRRREGTDFCVFLSTVYPQYVEHGWSFDLQLVFVEWVNEWMRQLSEWIRSRNEGMHVCIFREKRKCSCTIAPQGAGRPGAFMELQYLSCPKPQYRHIHT